MRTASFILVILCLLLGCENNPFPKESFTAIQYYENNIDNFRSSFEVENFIVELQYYPKQWLGREAVSESESEKSYFLLNIYPSAQFTDLIKLSNYLSFYLEEEISIYKNGNKINPHVFLNEGRLGKNNSYRIFFSIEHELDEDHGNYSLKFQGGPFIDNSLQLNLVEEHISSLKSLAI